MGRRAVRGTIRPAENRVALPSPDRLSRQWKRELVQRRPAQPVPLTQPRWQEACARRQLRGLDHRGHGTRRPGDRERRARSQTRTCCGLRLTL